MFRLLSEKELYTLILIIRYIFDMNPDMLMDYGEQMLIFSMTAVSSKLI